VYRTCVAGDEELELLAAGALSQPCTVRRQVLAVAAIDDHPHRSSCTSPADTTQTKNHSFPVVLLNLLYPDGFFGVLCLCCVPVPVRLRCCPLVSSSNDFLTHLLTGGLCDVMVVRWLATGQTMVRLSVMIPLRRDDPGKAVHARVLLSPSSIIWYRSTVGWEDNRRRGVALTMRHRLQWFIDPRAQGLGQRNEHPANTPNFTLLTYLIRSIFKMLGPFATTSRLTPIHQVSPLYCRTPHAHRCPQRQRRRRRRRQRQRVTEGTAMAHGMGPITASHHHY